MKNERAIFKIRVGENPLRGALTYFVGQLVTRKDVQYKITAILEDWSHNHETEEGFMFFGTARFNVYAKEEGEEEFIWDFFERVPISVQPALPTKKRKRI